MARGSPAIRARASSAPWCVPTASRLWRRTRLCRWASGWRSSSSARRYLARPEIDFVFVRVLRSARMTRALAILAAMVVVATGCATRGAVTRLRADLAQLRSELAYTRAAQETAIQDIAHATAELRALDARTRELAGRVRETADEAARLGTRTGAAEDAVRETRARVQTLATPPPAPPVAPPPARPAAAQSAPPVERPAREPHEARAVAPERAYAAAMASFRANEHGQAVLDLLDFLAATRNTRLPGTHSTGSARRTTCSMTTRRRWSSSRRSSITAA